MLRRTAWVALFAVGCAPGNPGLQIGGVLAPNDSCILESSGTTLSSGTLDVNSSIVSYSVTLALFNQLVNISQGGPPMADPNVISLVEAEVELQDSAGGLAAVGGPNPFTAVATGFVPSSSGSTVGEGVGTIQIIPPSYGEALRASAGTRIIAVIRAVGLTAGNAEVVTYPFSFPIDLCAGCLFSCQMDMEGLPICAPACQPGQDQLTLSCNVDAAGHAASCVPTM